MLSFISSQWLVGIRLALSVVQENILAAFKANQEVYKVKETHKFYKWLMYWQLCALGRRTLYVICGKYWSWKGRTFPVGTCMWLGIEVECTKEVMSYSLFHLNCEDKSNALLVEITFLLWRFLKLLELCRQLGFLFIHYSILSIFIVLLFLYFKRKRYHVNILSNLVTFSLSHEETKLSLEKYVFQCTWLVCNMQHHNK